MSGERLAARVPGALSPEGLEQGVVAVENVALGFAHVCDTDRESAARTQPAFSVAGILPKMPLSERRDPTRLRVIIGDPKPAVGKDSALRAGRAGESLAQTIFAPVNARIFSGPLLDSLTKGDGLRNGHV